MNTYLSSAQLKDRAKACLSGHYGFLIGAILIEGLIIYALSLLVPAAALPFSISRLLLGETIRFCLSVFTGVFNVGFAFIYLKLACGSRPVLSDIFYGFSRCLGTSLLISLVFNVFSLLPLATYIPAFLGVQSRNVKIILLALPVLAITTAAYILLWLMFSQCYYLMLDFPNKTAGEILSLSLRLMRGQKGRLFCILLSFLPLLLLGWLSIVGTIWVGPYLQMAMALFYLDIMKPAQKN